MVEMTRSEVLFDSVTRLMRRSAFSHIRRLLLKAHPSEVAGVLRQLPDDQALQLLSQIRNSETEALAICELGSSFLETFLNKTDDKGHVAAVLQKIPEDEAANLLADLDEEDAKEIMALMQSVTQEEVTEILDYEEGTCGRIMAVNVFALNQNLTAREAINEIQNTNTPESLFYIYVMDDLEKLVGVVSLRQILQVEKSLKLCDFMTRDVIKVTSYQSQEEAAHYIEEYNYVCLPVVDESDILVGMVTVDDIIDFIRDEADEEVLQLAGLEKEAIEDFSFFRAFSSRGFWYFLLLAGGILSAELILYFFPDFPQKFYILAFAPLVLRMGGSIAMQTSTFVHQSVLSDDVQRSLAIRALWGQNAVTFIVAFLLAVVAYCFTLWRLDTSSQYAFGVAAGFVSVAFFSLCLGLLVPYLSSKIKLDSVKVTSRLFHFVMDFLSLAVFFFFVWYWQIYV